MWIQGKPSSMQWVGQQTLGNRWQTMMILYFIRTQDKGFWWSSLRCHAWQQKNLWAWHQSSHIIREKKKFFFFISSRSIVFDSLWSHGLYSPWNSLGQNTGVGNISLLQEIFPIQELNPGLPHCGRILYRLSHKGSPRILGWVPIPSTGDFPNTGIQPGPPALQRESLPTKLSGKPKIWHL